MDEIVAGVARLLARDVAGFAREVAAYPDDDSLWQTAPGVVNSTGNLAWHVAGNLQYYIGAVLGQTGYVRNRDLEFSRRSGTRDETLAELARAGAVVARVLPTLTPDALDADFPGLLPKGLRIQTRFLLMQLPVHAGFHLGQAGYLRRVVTGNTQSTNPVPLIE